MTKFLIPSNPALFKRWEDLSDELQRSFKEKSYRERLDFWSKHCLEPMRYFRFPLRRRDPDYEVVGYITPENPEDRPLFYDFFKPYFMYQYSELCDLEKKKRDLHDRLDFAPDKQLLLQTEYDRMSELKTIGRGTGQTYYMIGYNTTLEGRSLDFSRLDEYTHYWRLLEGETTFRYITYVKNLLDYNDLKTIVEDDDEDHRWSIAQRQYLLEKFGFYKLDSFKKLSTGNQDKLLSVLLKTDERTIRGVRNQNNKYQLSEQKRIEIDQFYSNLIE